MTTQAVTLIQRVRRFLGDYPDLDILQTGMLATGSSVIVEDSTRYAVNWYIQIGSEMMRVSALPNNTTLTVQRGARGTTAFSHTAGDPILIRPAFSDLEILDALNGGISASYPYFYKDDLDTSITTDGSSYEYTTVPSGIRMLSKVETKESGSPYYYRIDGWTVKRGGGTVTLQFATPPIQGTLRLWGYGPFPALASSSDNLDTQWPSWGEDILLEYAAQRLLMSSEARRVRLDAGPQDDAQSQARQGVAASAASGLLQRFQLRLSQQPMPPMPRHLVRIF